jgi:glucose/arabinose dehydrogenase
MKKRILALIVFVVLGFVVTAQARGFVSSDIKTPKGFEITATVKDLASPTMVAFDTQGRMVIAESGYDGSGTPKVTRIESDGSKTVLAEGEVFGSELPVTSVAVSGDSVYVAHAGTISVIKGDGTFAKVIDGLPGQGDHQIDQMQVKNGSLYFTIGTVTNSGVVGTDNAVFGWLNTPMLQNLHDVPCQDILLKGATFESDNPLAAYPEHPKTAPYSPFGFVPKDKKIPGNSKCNGALLKVGLDGSGLSVVAWGFRNPYGLETGPDGNFYVTMHGFDARGSRPIENAWDCFYKVVPGAWYGFPDFACEVAVTDKQFKAEGKPIPDFIWATHPTEHPPSPIAKFNPHSAINGFAFAPNDTWGKPTDVYIAEFGDFTPATGTASSPQGVKVIRLDTQTGQTADFLVNKQAGQASRHSAGGLEHPSDVAFGPDGAMYIADWGIARVSQDGLKLEENSGVIWKVTPQEGAKVLPLSTSGFKTLLWLLAFALLTYFLTRGRADRPVTSGIVPGIISAVAMGAASFLISALVLDLPWYAPARVFAVMVMGRDALANILEFHALPFLLGLGVVVALGLILGWIFGLLNQTEGSRAVLAGGAYGLTVWALMQYFFLPTVFPLITEKGFPPFWYAVCFAVFGLVLGYLTRRSSKQA